MSLIKLPLEERPRERLDLYGAQALSLSELLAIILGNGIKGKTAIDLAQELLSDFGSLTQLMNASVQELSQVKGVGRAKALQIKAMFELTRRLSKEVQPFPILVDSFDEIAFLLQRYIVGKMQEHIYVVCLNIRGAVTHIEEVGKGTLSAVLVHPRDVFSIAIRHKAAQIIIAHNHPSGNATPSQKDLEITREFQKAGELMQIPVIEHIVLSETAFTLILEQQTKFF